MLGSFPTLVADIEGVATIAQTVSKNRLYHVEVVICPFLPATVKVINSLQILVIYTGINEQKIFKNT